MQKNPWLSASALVATAARGCESAGRETKIGVDSTDQQADLPVLVTEGPWPMTSRPVLVPVVVGRKTTITAQLVFGATALPELLVWLKSPLVVMLSIRLDAMPVALSVTVCGELTVPTLWLPKVNSNVEGRNALGGTHGTKPPQPPQQTCKDTRIATLKQKSHRFAEKSTIIGCCIATPPLGLSQFRAGGMACCYASRAH